MPPRQLASIRPLPLLSLRKPREAPEDGYKSHVKEKMRVGKLLQEKKEENSLDCFSSGLSRVREERENQKKRAREDIEEKVRERVCSRL